MGEYSFTITRDSTIPHERARALKRISTILARFPNGLPDRANCFVHGLVLGWAVSEVIGLADADEVDALLPPRPDDVINLIPYGPKEVEHPELAALTEDEIPDGIWFDFWMGIKRNIYLFEQRRTEMPERLVLAWLGFLRGELEGKGVSQPEYDKMRSMLPSVKDDLTPLVVASA